MKKDIALLFTGLADLGRSPDQVLKVAVQFIAKILIRGPDIIQVPVIDKDRFVGIGNDHDRIIPQHHPVKKELEVGAGKKRFFTGHELYPVLCLQFHMLDGFFQRIIHQSYLPR